MPEYPIMIHHQTCRCDLKLPPGPRKLKPSFVLLLYFCIWVSVYWYILSWVRRCLFPNLYFLRLFYFDNVKWHLYLTQKSTEFKHYFLLHFCMVVSTKMVFTFVDTIRDPFGLDYSNNVKGRSILVFDPQEPKQFNKGASSSSVDWSQLPNDVVIAIANQIVPVQDFVAFKQARDSWHFACSNMNWTQGPLHPWSTRFKKQNIFNVFKDERYQLVPWVIRGNQYYGSPQGWILAIGPQSQLHLVHFFTRARIALPALHSIQNQLGQVNDWFSIIHKFIVFVGPRNRVVIMAIFGPTNRLAFVRRGYGGWVIVSDGAHFRDVVVFRGQFYALCLRGTLVQCRLGYGGSEILRLALPPRSLELYRPDKMYLVESSRNLFAVFRFGYTEGKRYETTFFLVHMYDFDALEWERKESLGDSTLFVGDGNSWSIAAHKVDDCRSNCIYFTDNYWEQQGAREATNGGHYIGLFDMERRKIEGFQYVVGFPPQYFSTPFCLTPTLVR